MPAPEWYEMEMHEECPYCFKHLLVVVHLINPKTSFIKNNEVQKFYKLRDEIVTDRNGWKQSIKSKLFIQDNRLLKFFGDNKVPAKSIYIVWPLVWAQKGTFKWFPETIDSQNELQVSGRPRYIMPDFFKQYELEQTIESVGSIFEF